jgi:hypothetical protein
VDTKQVKARGNQGRDIDADDSDRKLWLETLGEAQEAQLAHFTRCRAAVARRLVCRENGARSWDFRVKLTHLRSRGVIFWRWRLPMPTW